MSTRATYLNIGLLLIASTFLSACGGGGGGGGGSDTAASNPVVITSANAPEVSGAAFNSTAGLQGGGTGAIGTLPLVGTVTQTSGTSINIADALVSQLHVLRPHLAAASASQVTGVVVSQSIPCTSGGSLNFTFTDVDNNGDLSSGDSLTFSASNCYEDGLTMAGSVTIDNVVVSGDPMSFPYTLQFRIQASGFSISESSEVVALNGTMVLSQTTNDGITFSNTVSGSSIQINGGGTVATLANYSISGTEDGTTGAYTLDMGATVTSSELGGSVVIVSDVMFQGIEPDNPWTGQATITGANNSRVTLIALDAVNVRLEVDADGNGVAETTIDTTWDAL